MAEALRAEAQLEPFHAVYSSDLLRTVQTAQALSDPLGLQARAAGSDAARVNLCGCPGMVMAVALD